MKTTEILEGKAKLIVPDLSFYKIPGHAPVFYNPDMTGSRDISVSLARAVSAKTVCDPLSATGVRAIRYCLEAGCEGTANDINPEAYEIIKENVKRNGLSKKIEVSERDANSLMHSSERFDLVDIDPFGSPIRFIDSGLRALKNSGVITLTATDTAPLSGTYVKKCLRRYGSRPIKTGYHHEVGVRILLWVLARYAYSQDKVIEPLLSHASLHYYKIFARVKKGSRYENIGYLHHCWKCGNRLTDQLGRTQTCCGAEMEKAGPLWTGSLGSVPLLKKMENCNGIIETCISEYPLPAFFYDLHELCGIHKVDVPSFAKLGQRFKDIGYRFSRTHFSRYGFRTDASFEDVIKEIRRA